MNDERYTMNKKGFTLIEMLVVMGIIAMIVSLALPNYIGARERAKDNRRKQELRQLKMALRLYYNDYGKYPAGLGTGMKISGCGSDGTGDCPCSSSVYFAVDDTSTPELCDKAVYMKQISSEFASKIFYYQKNSGDDFCLRGLLDNASDPDTTVSQNRCASICGASCTGTQKYCECTD
jgi:prepilin-type N-terminal cleavage/methylation domain-containing protein